MIVKSDNSKMSFDGKIIDLIFPIENFIIVNNKVLVLLELTEILYSSLNKEEIDRNILAYDLNGNFLWRIQRVKELYRESSNPFSSLFIENDIIKAYNVNCATYIINPEDGSVTRILLPRSRPW